MMFEFLAVPVWCSCCVFWRLCFGGEGGKRARMREECNRSGLRKLAVRHCFLEGWVRLDSQHSTRTCYRSQILISSFLLANAVREHQTSISEGEICALPQRIIEGTKFVFQLGMTVYLQRRSLMRDYQKTVSYKAV